MVPSPQSDLGVEYRRDQTDGQEGEGPHRDDGGEPAIIQRHAATTYGADGKTRGRHGGVVHAGDGEAHNGRGTDVGGGLEAAVSAAQVENEPKRDERSAHGDRYREHYDRRVIPDARDERN